MTEGPEFKAVRGNNSIPSFVTDLCVHNTNEITYMQITFLICKTCIKPFVRHISILVQSKSLFWNLPGESPVNCHRLISSSGAWSTLHQHSPVWFMRSHACSLLLRVGLHLLLIEGHRVLLALVNNSSKEDLRVDGSTVHATASASLLFISISVMVVFYATEE